MPVVCQWFVYIMLTMCMYVFAETVYISKVYFVLAYKVEWNGMKEHVYLEWIIW